MRLPVARTQHRGEATGERQCNLCSGARRACRLRTKVLRRPGSLSSGTPDVTTAAKSLSESIQSIAEGKILANRVIAFQMSRGGVGSDELPLPPEALELLLTVGIFVVVEQRANIERWHFEKGVCFQ